MTEMTLTANAVQTKLFIGDINVDDAPNAASLLHEHSKTVISLATAFFALTVTFAEKLIGADPEAWQIVGLSLVWLILLFSILEAVSVVVKLNRYLTGQASDSKGTTPEEKAQGYGKVWKKAARAATVSYFALLIAALLLGGVGLAKLAFTRPGNALTAAAAASEFLRKMPAPTPSRWSVESLKSTADGKETQVLLVNTTGKRVCVTVTGSRDKITTVAPCDALSR